MSIDEAIEVFQADTSETILNLSELRSDEIAQWLTELKAFRLFKEKCKQYSYTVRSELFAKHMDDYLKELEEQSNERSNMQFQSSQI